MSESAVASTSSNETKNPRNQNSRGGGGGGRGGRHPNGGRGRGRGRRRGRGRGRSNSRDGNTNINNQNMNRGEGMEDDEGDSGHLPTTGNSFHEEIHDLVDDTNEEHPEHHHCLVCYSPTLHKNRAITPCNHNSICASCHIRLRSLLNDKRCPVCKATNETLIVDADPDPNVNEHKQFDQYQRWGDDIGPNHIYRDDVQMFFPVNYYHLHVAPLFNLKCYIKGCNYGQNDGNGTTLKGLNHHLAAAHSLSLCMLCVDNKRDFISRLPRFTPNQLKDHNKYGEMNKKLASKASKPIGAKGHPLCQFCAPKRFYDLTALHEHLNKEHYKCHLCEQQDVHNQFFRDYNQLNRHFDKEHYLCHHPDCLAARFVAFANELDLIVHERDLHNILRSSGNRLNIEFSYRPSTECQIINQTVPDLEEDFNYGLNGEVFVPDALDSNGNVVQQQTNEPEISHGPHAERTAFLREQARQRRIELRSGEDAKEAEEAFPALGQERGSGGGLISWSNPGSTTVAALRGRNSTSLTEQNFPSLSGAPKKKKSSITSKLTVSKPTSRQSASTVYSIAAVSRSMGAPPPYTAQNHYAQNAATSATLNSRANLSANNFPSLGPSTSISSSTNKYAAAQAFAKKNQARGTGFDLNQDFPPPMSLSNNNKKTANKPSVFEQKAKAPSKEALDNVIAFPPPPKSSAGIADGKAQVNSMKIALGPTKYKQLKSYTKDFAKGTLDPESYVSSSLSLFERGVEDPCFWEFVPSLIASVPNESSSKRATRYLESLRYPLLQNEASITSTNNSKSDKGGSWSNTPGSLKNAPPSLSSSSSTTTASMTGFNSRNVNSFPITQAKKKSAWGGKNAPITKSLTSAKIGSAVALAATEAPKKGTATKYMAKQSAQDRKAKQIESESNAGGAGKKKKAKAKKEELRNLAFGGSTR